MTNTGKLALSPKLDIVFKKLFTENEQEFRVFLSDMLGIPLESIQELEYLNTERTPEAVSEKLSRMDICLHMADRTVDVEIQVKNSKDYQQRSLFYWARLYVSGFKRGEQYLKLRPAITLNLLDFVLFSERKPYHATIVPEFRDDHKIFSNHLEIHYIELPKARFPLEKWKIMGKIRRKKLWILFLNAKTWEDLEMLENANHPEINQIIEAYRMLCEDEAFSLAALNRDMEIHDYVSDMANSHEEGVNEGIAIGEERGIAIGEERGIAIGEERGIAIGEERGIAIGEERGIATSALLILKNTSCDAEAACALLGLQEPLKTRILSMITEQKTNK